MAILAAGYFLKIMTEKVIDSCYRAGYLAIAIIGGHVPVVAAIVYYAKLFYRYCYLLALLLAKTIVNVTFLHYITIMCWVLSIKRK
jgi:hypothetical protein